MAFFKHFHLTLVACRPRNHAPCFAAFSRFLQNGLFAGLLRSPFNSGSLQIPVRYLLFNAFIPFGTVWPIHLHFLILICNITGSSPVPSHSSSLLIILRHFKPIILRKHRLSNVCNLFILVVTSHVSHPYSSINLTLPLNTRILIFIRVFLFFHNGNNSTTIHSAFLMDTHMGWS